IALTASSRNRRGERAAMVAFAVDVAGRDVDRDRNRRALSCEGAAGTGARKYRRVVDVGEGDAARDHAAQAAGAVVGLDRERRRALAAVMHEADVAGAKLGAGEGRCISPDAAVARRLELAVA